jgi:hypothetical protein
MLNAKAGGVIEYYKSDSADGVSTSPSDISIQNTKKRYYHQ